MEKDWTQKKTVAKGSSGSEPDTNARAQEVEAWSAPRHAAAITHSHAESRQCIEEAKSFGLWHFVSRW